MEKFKLSNKTDFLNFGEDDSAFLDLTASKPINVNLESIIVKNLTSADSKVRSMAIISIANLSVRGASLGPILLDF